MTLYVLRLGHRLPRDERISTHVALVARAFGADGIIYTGQHDGGLESSVSRIAEHWGGPFSIRYEKNPLKVIRDRKADGYVLIHLTMYGLPLAEVLGSPSWVLCFGPKPNPSHTKLLVVVGGEQVPGEIYAVADYNVAVTSQPHSEVAALAVFLDRLNGGKALEREWDGRFRGKIKIVPGEKGKKTVSG